MGFSFSKTISNCTEGHHLNYEEVWYRRGQPSVSPDGFTTSPVSNHYLLSSAVEIVTRQRVAEQLENLLLNLDLNRENLDNSQNNSSTVTGHQERFFHSLTPPEQYSRYRDRQTEANQDFNFAFEDSAFHVTRSDNRGFIFSTLHELFAYLLQSNEIRLKENWQAVMASTLNTVSAKEDDSDFDTEACEVNRSKPIKCFLEMTKNIDEMNDRELRQLSLQQQSFNNLFADVRERSFLGSFCDKCSGKIEVLSKIPKEIFRINRRNRPIMMNNDLPASKNNFFENDNIFGEASTSHVTSQNLKVYKHFNRTDTGHQIGLIYLMRYRECGVGATNLRHYRCSECTQNIENLSKKSKKSKQLQQKEAKNRNEESSSFFDAEDFRVARGRHRSHVTALTEAQRVVLNNNYLPNQMRIVDCVETKTFCVAYLNDGNEFITASQDRQIRRYRTRGSRQRFALRETLTVPHVGWSILDVALSPDGRHLIYSTWNESIFQYDLSKPEDGWKHLYMDFFNQTRMGFFSLRFNADGREIVAGANDNRVYVYDREAGRCALALNAHDDDVNAVCFGDMSSHLILSGADDGLCKVWDRRIIGDLFGDRPVGTFAGHCDGISYIDARGDDRYFLTNSKDQTIKLWDMRVFANEQVIEASKKSVSRLDWDYRYNMPPPFSFLEGDCSVATLSGHYVLHTLVRARFSPDHTGKRFIYTGCGRGNCVVYDFLTGEIVKVYSGHAGVVRDCLWHPHYNEILTTSWDGRTYLWRYDERRNSTSQVVSARSFGRRVRATENYRDSDEDSCDENYEPIRRHRVVPSHIKRFRHSRNVESSD